MSSRPLAASGRPAVKQLKRPIPGADSLASERWRERRGGRFPKAVSVPAARSLLFIVESRSNDIGSTLDKIREAWAASIPQHIDGPAKTTRASTPAYGAIVAPPPPASMLVEFFKSLGPMHLAADQRRANETRMA